MIILMGKDFVNPTPVNVSDNSSNRSSLTYAYNSVFRANNDGYYRIWMIGGGGGGLANPVGSPSLYYDHGDGGNYSLTMRWIGRDTIKVHSNGFWAQNGPGGLSGVVSIEPPTNGFFSFIANGTSSYLITASGGAAGSGSSTDPSFSVAPPSDWTNAGLSGGYGKGGDGRQGGAGSASNGNRGQIRVQRIL